MKNREERKSGRRRRGGRTASLSELLDALLVVDQVLPGVNLSRNQSRIRSYRIDHIIDCLDLGFDERVCRFGCRNLVNYSGIETLRPAGIRIMHRLTLIRVLCENASSGKGCRWCIVIGCVDERGMGRNESTGSHRLAPFVGQNPLNLHLPVGYSQPFGMLQFVDLGSLLGRE